MKKPILIALFSCLVILAAQASVHAAELPQPKFTGKSVTNPDRPLVASSAMTAAADSAPPQNAFATQAMGGADFSMYAVWFDFSNDSDGDGYYHQFDLSFDIDSRFSNASVYVQGQLSDGTALPLFTTQPFTISGATGADSYRVTVLLTEGYPTNHYALTLKVYDAQTHALLLTYGPQQNANLNPLYLEDVSREAAYDSRLQLFLFEFTLSGDYDQDGYFTQADIRLDADAPQQSLRVYAMLYLIDSSGEWIPVQTSSNFSVNGYSSLDTQTLGIGLDGGFDPQPYHFGIELYDAQSHNLLLTATTPQTATAHMESLDYDNDSYGVETYYVEQHAGGVLHPFVLLALLPVLLLRRFRSTIQQR